MISNKYELQKYHAKPSIGHPTATAVLGVSFSPHLYELSLGVTQCRQITTPYTALVNIHGVMNNSGTLGNGISDTREAC